MEKTDFKLAIFKRRQKKHSSAPTNFNFDPDNRTLSFDVTGQNGTKGFCRVTIPKGFM
jgi:hypothetical protein